MNDFKIGDLVQLKSGGPVMTVTYLDGDKVHCRWFNKDNSTATVVVASATLQKVED